MFGVILLATVASLREEWYGESIEAELLSDGRAHVSLTMEMQTNLNEGGYAELFPEDFRRLATSLELEEMKLSFTRGAWRNSWGRQKVSAPPATSITAVLPERNWGTLVTQLGGLFSCSLHHLGNTHEIPHVISGVVKCNQTIRGYLPSEETFCTENFSPVLDLTPNKGSGFPTSPMTFFRTRYHAIHVLYSSAVKPTLKVIIEYVDEPGISGSYKIKVPERCELCTDNKIKATINVPPGVDTLSTIDNGQAEYGWESTYEADVAFFESRLRVPQVSMYSSEHSDGSGTLIWEISNIPSTAEGVLLNVLLPSKLLSAHVSRMAPGEFPFSVNKLESVFLVQVDCSNRKDSSFHISVPFDKHILPLDCYPPDANRLYLLPPSFLIITTGGHEDVIYPPKPAAITLPVPDFSMPFHIITLSCTAIALLLGTIFTHVTKDVNS